MRFITLTFALCILLLCNVCCALGAKKPPPLLLDHIQSVRQTAEGDGYGGEGFTVMPLLRDEEPATAIVIHGLGGSGEEWAFISLAMSFFSLNFVKFIMPSAETRYVTYMDDTMPSWFDIRGFADTSDINKTEMQASVKRINRIVKGEIQSGVKPARIFIIGFSQGGALALTTFLRSPRVLAGCIGVATWLPLDREYPQKLSNKIRDKDILMLHGSEDEAVALSAAEKSRDRLLSLNLHINLTVLIGEPHVMVNTRVITSIEDFITQRASGTTEFLKIMVRNITDSFASLSTRLEKVPRF